ncbi:DUF2993 domain-containing protein [Agromyces sp. ISL-38]|uniref:LmeA family phospholipid-binding protein n=1 Tax=Agromyces sp. ISL-38 TaxID=2819107 RepID=UPI001BE831A3|nr:DUF2993 domain-containing protein [Agromyces sp. ISL-38]MBT2498314.1 DUF2993 domain-containing protein [Agromyces sp. ISL-38]
MAERDDQPTEIFAPATPGTTARRPRRRAARAWIAVVVVVVAIGALLVVADVVTRNIAEQLTREQIEAGLPAGVEGDVDVSIGGFSMLAQLLSGTIDHVELSAPKLVVEGAPLDIDVVAEGVPIDLASPVANVDATIEIGQDAVNRLVTVPGIDGGLTFGQGTIGYEGTTDLLGVAVDYSVAAKPTAAGASVLLEPVDVTVGAGGAAIDVSDLIARLVGDDPLDVCVAQYLPEGVEVSSITITPGTAHVELDAQRIMIDRASLEQTGSCD